MNRTRNRINVVSNGKTVVNKDETYVSDDETFERNSDETIVIPKIKPIPYIGKISGILSLLFGCMALLFAVAPFGIGWFAAVFWLLYPFGLISLVCAIPAYFTHQVWRPTLGIILSLSSVTIAALCGQYYVLAMSGSVNGLMRIAKTFVDALQWPF